MKQHPAITITQLAWILFISAILFSLAAKFALADYSLSWTPSPYTDQTLESEIIFNWNDGIEDPEATDSCWEGDCAAEILCPDGSRVLYVEGVNEGNIGTAADFLNIGSHPAYTFLGYPEDCGNPTSGAYRLRIWAGMPPGADQPPTEPLHGEYILLTVLPEGSTAATLAISVPPFDGSILRRTLSSLFMILVVVLGIPLAFYVIGEVQKLFIRRRKQ